MTTEPQKVAEILPLTHTSVVFPLTSADIPLTSADLPPTYPTPYGGVSGPGAPRHPEGVVAPTQGSFQ